VCIDRWLPNTIFRTNNALRRFDIATGKGSVVLTEESDVWVNLYPDNMFSELTAQGKKDGSDGEVREALFCLENIQYKMTELCTCL
jgi:hypothetical protein